MYILSVFPRSRTSTVKTWRELQSDGQSYRQLVYQELRISAHHCKMIRKPIFCFPRLRWLRMTWTFFYERNVVLEIFWTLPQPLWKDKLIKMLAGCTLIFDLLIANFSNVLTVVFRNCWGDIINSFSFDATTIEKRYQAKWDSEGVPASFRKVNDVSMTSNFITQLWIHVQNYELFHRPMQ